MPKLSLVLPVAMLGLLAACAGQPTEVEEPSISYSYDDRDEYDEVAERADDYCEDNYDRDAYLIDEDTEGGDYEATFACR